ncbi:MAG: carboxypeptidase-like regulatory domain-containing protein [Bacteroidales bacterium]|nr:carboxypeptidase-like regulatory domain-containing protein [Bacteroidales bacterium]
MNFNKIILSIILFSLTHIVYSQQTITGRVVNEKEEALINAFIFIENTDMVTTTDLNGEFNLVLSKEVNEFIVSYVGFVTQTIKISEETKNYNIVLNVSTTIEEVQVLGMSSSPLSYWYGAEATYSFVEDLEYENFAGSAPLKIGTYDIKNNGNFGLFLVGNIANILSVKSEELEKNATAVAQTNKGVSIGVSPVYTLKKFGTKKKPMAIRTYGTIFYKYNVFKLDSADISGDQDINLDFPQFGINVGLEAEVLYLKDDLKPSLFYVNFYRNSFYKKRFLLLKEVESNNIYGLEVGAIFAIPILPLGFKATYNVSNHFDGYFTVGFVIKNI